MIGRFSPDAVAGQLHCAEAESVNGNVPTDYARAAPGGGPRIGSVGMLSRGTFSGRAHNIYTRSFSVSMVSLTKPCLAKKFFGFMAMSCAPRAQCSLRLTSHVVIRASRFKKSVRQDIHESADHKIGGSTAPNRNCDNPMV